MDPHKDRRAIELAPLDRPDATRPADDQPTTLQVFTELREQEKAEKRQAKRDELFSSSDMKFSHSIQFNAVPDWSSHYIAYSNLKKL